MKTDKSNLTYLSPDRIREAANVIDPHFRDTPQFISDALSRRIGLRVLCRIECLNPVGSFKGRGAEYWCHREARSAVPLVTATTGNFGQALTYTARRPKDYQPVFHKQELTAVPYPASGRKY